MRRHSLAKSRFHFSINTLSRALRGYNAIQVFRTGGPECLRFVKDIPTLPLSSNEVRVSTRSIGVNYHDTYIRTGLYPANLPCILGCEASGLITETGGKTDNLHVGDRVAFFHYNSGYSTEAVVPEDACFKLPDNVSFELGAASLVQGLTAHYLSHDSFQLRPSSTCLIHAAGGGTGNLLVQMAKLQGATVIATTSPQKSEAARKAGADHVVEYGNDYKFADRVKGFFPKGVDVVYDSIGLKTVDESLLSLKLRGTCILYGNSSGQPAAILPTPTLASGSWYLQRPVLQHFLLDETERQRRASVLFSWIGSGMLNVRIAKVFSLESATEAHRYLESRQALGKVLLDPVLNP